jgi:hypothetical protein
VHGLWAPGARRRPGAQIRRRCDSQRVTLEAVRDAGQEPTGEIFILARKEVAVSAAIYWGYDSRVLPGPYTPSV